MKASPSSKRTFDDFNDYEHSLVTAKVLCKKFVDDVKAHPWSGGYCLSLCGKSGTGKTMLAEIVLSALGLNGWGNCDEIPEALIAGALCKFTTHLFYMPKISDQFKALRFGSIEEMIDQRFAVLDDIGADYDPSKITASKVDRVLRERKGKWTLVTFNLPLSEIAAKIDSRVASFIIRDDNRFVQIVADDYAKRKMNGNR
ncbi:MAG: hypothetical protein KGL39_49365 [Patescibacteria group bacterium]|nr:hypothetical protein [Patescibacteria group bacterium]